MDRIAEKVASRSLAAGYADIAKVLEKSRQEGTSGPEDFDKRRFEDTIDYTCKALQALKKGPADYRTQLNRIGGGLHGVMLNYGTLAK